MCVGTLRSLDLQYDFFYTVGLGRVVPSGTGSHRGVLQSKGDELKFYSV